MSRIASSSVLRGRDRSAVTGSHPTQLQTWLLAIRPKTLPAALAPVIVGTAVAIKEDDFAPLTAFVCVVVALLLQIAANLANDVFDFHRGADTAERLGPVRVTQRGLIAPERVLLATWVVVGAAALAGLYLVWRGGWPIALLGMLSILAALAYTGGPWPLGYLGLGEVFVFLFFGMVGVAGTAYVQTRELTAQAVVAAIPIGCLAAAILVVNNLRDIASDRVAGKRTLAVRLGRRGTELEYAMLLIVAYLTLAVGGGVGLLSGWWWLAGLSLPLAVTVTRRVMRTSGAALNPLLAATARLELLVALLVAGGMVL